VNVCVHHSASASVEHLASVAQKAISLVAALGISALFASLMTRVDLEVRARQPLARPVSLLQDTLAHFNGHFFALVSMRPGNVDDAGVVGRRHAAVRPLAAVLRALLAHPISDVSLVDVRACQAFALHPTGAKMLLDDDVFDMHRFT